MSRAIKNTLPVTGHSNTMVTMASQPTFYHVFAFIKHILFIFSSIIKLQENHNCINIVDTVHCNWITIVFVFFS